MLALAGVLFVVWIARKGELAAYAALFTGAAQQAQANANNQFVANLTLQPGAAYMAPIGANPATG